MANDTPRTTATLRATLLDAIDRLIAGQLTAQDATAIAKLSEQTIKTADLEMRFTKHVAEIDKSSTGVAPGPMLLSQK